MGKVIFTHNAAAGRWDLARVERPKNYDPLKDENGYMNLKMLSFFWQKLRNDRVDIENKLRSLRGNIAAIQAPDQTDRAAQENNRADDHAHIEKLLAKRNILTFIIDEIESNGINSEYGYCVDSGKHIGVERLMAVPTARRTIEAQEKHDRYLRDRGLKNDTI